MGCHLGWHFTVGCPGAAEENINNKDFFSIKKQLRKINKEKNKQINTVHTVHISINQSLVPVLNSHIEGCLVVRPHPTVAYFAACNLWQGCSS
jgi:hypothetical protein